MCRRVQWSLFWSGCLVAFLALPAKTPAQAPTSSYSSRLLALQQQSAFQQQQGALQLAVQETAILVQTLQQQSGTPIGTLGFQQQQMALQNAIQQTSALLQTSHAAGNSPMARAALGQLNTLQAILQQSMRVQSALAAQQGTLTPQQLLSLSQQAPTLASLLAPPPAWLPAAHSSTRKR